MSTRRVCLLTKDKGEWVGRVDVGRAMNGSMKRRMINELNRIRACLPVLSR